MELLGIGAAHDHGEGVFKAKGLGDFQVEALGVAILDTLVDGF